MTARIYQPTKNAMQSGTANSKKWILEFTPAADSCFFDPLMSWKGSTDMRASQVKLSFTSKQQAIAYADAAGITYDVSNPQYEKLKIKSYSDNFKKY